MPPDAKILKFQRKLVMMRLNNLLSDNPRSFPVSQTIEQFSGAVMRVISDTVELSSGPTVRDYVDHLGAVAIVPWREHDGKAQVALVHQYRHPVRSELWEIPAGLLDHAGESWFAAAQRELAEEVSLRAKQWHTLIDYYTSPGGSNEFLRIFLARQCFEIEQNHFDAQDEEAFMTWEWIDYSQVLKAVLTGRIHNPSTVIGLLALHAHLATDFEHLRDPRAPWSNGLFTKGVC